MNATIESRKTKLSGGNIHPCSDIPDATVVAKIAGDAFSDVNVTVEKQK